MANKKQNVDKKVAKERAKQIEKMMEDKDTSPIIKWVYSNRLFLTIIIAILLITVIGFAVVFGVKKTYGEDISEEYLSAYDILREIEEQNALIELKEGEKAELKKELLKVIEKGNNTLFKTYTYRLANYYMGIIEYSDANFEGSSGSIHYFKEASSGKSSYPFKDYAYYNIGKSYEQQGYVYQSDGSIDKAKEIYNKAINHYINMEKKFKNSFLSLRAKYQAGVLYETFAELTDDKDEKLSYYSEAEIIYEEIQNTTEYEAGKTTAFLDTNEIVPEVKKEKTNFIDNVDNSLLRIGIIKNKIKKGEFLESDDESETEEEASTSSNENELSIPTNEPDNN